MKTWMASGFCVLSIMALPGCGEASSDGRSGSVVGTTAPEAAPNTSSLTVVEADELSGKVVLTYQPRGRSIRYELRVGGPMEQPPVPAELARNPELPTYAVDARVVDAGGQTFMMQMATDRFMDQSWTVDPVENVDVPGRVADLKLVEEAVAELRKLKLHGALDQARLTALQLGVSLPDILRKDADGSEASVPTVEQGALEPQSTVRQSGPTSVKYWDFIVKRTAALEVGDHSAVALRAWASNKLTVLATYYSCNHGSCASAGHMREHCIMPGFKTDDGSHRRYFYSETRTNTCELTDSCVTGGCLTAYYFSSACRYHNCNDDTEIQGRAIWTNQPQDQRGGTCNGCSLNFNAPGCSY